MKPNSFDNNSSLFISINKFLSLHKGYVIFGSANRLSNIKEMT